MICLHQSPLPTRKSRLWPAPASRPHTQYPVLPTPSSNIRKTSQYTSKLPEHTPLTVSQQWRLQHLISLPPMVYTLHPPNRSSSHSPYPPTLTPSSTYSSLSTQLPCSSSSQLQHQKTALRLHLSGPSYTRCPTATTLPSRSAQQSTRSHIRLTSHNVWRCCLLEKQVVIGKADG